MDAALYQPVFFWSVTLLCVVMSYRYLASPNYELQETRQDVFFRIVLPLSICIVLVFWLGYRPITYQFGDTFNYALIYTRSFDIDGMMMLDTPESSSRSGEWIWTLLMDNCRNAGLDVSVFFTIVEAGYVLSALWAVMKLAPSNPMLALLFALSSLMFYSFGINGIRNGLACHLVLLAMAFLFDGKYVVGGILCFLAFNIHHSTALPIFAILVGMFVIKDVRYAIGIWLISIFVSLLVGNLFVSLFASLGFDDRMESYVVLTEGNSQFSRVGFRWDFLLYSAMPVLMAWYVSVRQNIQDNWYNALSVAYCLSNAFWVLVIRAEYSNRFAYLSWFLYPLVIAYPLINMPVWADQDRKTGQILLAHCGFSVFMNLIYW